MRNLPSGAVTRPLIASLDALCQNHVSFCVTVGRSLFHDVPLVMKSAADCHIAR